MNIDEMPAGREMDALVAEKVFGWYRRSVPKDADGLNDGVVLSPEVLTDDYQFPPKGKIPFDYFVPHYSTDIAAAWKIVEKFKTEGLWMSVSTHCVSSDTRWVCEYSKGDVVIDFERADTAPLAICRAAIAALKAVSQ